MEEDARRSLIRAKLCDGRLPMTISPRLAGWLGTGETCDACGEAVRKPELIVETMAQGGVLVRFDASCLRLWEQERRHQG